MCWKPSCRALPKKIFISTLTTITLPSAPSTKRKKENKDEKKAFVRQERYYGAYERRFDVSGIDVDAIKAGYENGVLTLELPKAPEIKPEVKKIEIQ